MIHPRTKLPQSLGASSWFTAKKGVVESGGLVSIWDNQVNSGNPYTQATSNQQPALTTLRGLPVLAFQGSPIKSIATSSSPTNASRTFTVYTVSMMSSNTIGTAVNLINASLHLSRYETNGQSTSFIYVGTNFEPRLTASGLPSNSIPNIRRSSYDNGTGAHTLKINNGAEESNTRTPSGAFLTAASISNAATNTPTLYVHEQIWFPRVVSASEDEQIRNYLSFEWGIDL